MMTEGRTALFAAVLALAGAACAESLAPEALEKLPLGAIRPDGWLKRQLDLQAVGLAGRILPKIGQWLKPENGWLKPDTQAVLGSPLDGWEDQPYWFRAFVRLAALEEDPRLLAMARDWTDKLIAGADADGWFGPQSKKAYEQGGRTVTDIWGHMLMCDALWAWYEYSHDERIVALLGNFFRFCNALPDDRLLPTPFKGLDWHFTIQNSRACDLNPTLYVLYGKTRDESCLSLARRLFDRCKPPKTYMDTHTVNFAQRFAYPTLFWRQSDNPAHRIASDYWYDLHMSVWGQMPRGAFAADEQVRVGCYDPRYATESCTWSELTRSFQLLGSTTGEAKWADRTEDIVFNHHPAAFNPEWTRLHYLTACNQVSLDVATDHNYYDRPPMIAYSEWTYRCCRHNAHLPLPLFTENLTRRGRDGALVFWMYAPHHGTAALKGGDVRWRMDTRYPFRETAEVEIVPPAGAKVPVRFRVPKWATAFEVSSGGRTLAAAKRGDAWLDLPRPIATKTRLSVRMGASCGYTFWPRTGAVTVDRGPLSYSLAIGVKRQTRIPPARFDAVAGSPIWPEAKDEGRYNKFEEFLPTTPWNYGLDVSTLPEFRERDWSDDCFAAETTPCEIFAKGRRLPSWTLQDGQPFELQESPAYSAEPLETLRFIPLGAARLRLSVLPQVTDGPEGRRWTPVPPTTLRANRPKNILF